MAEIVNEADFLDDEEDVRIVRLTSTYAYDIAELYANISPRQVRLRRISSDKQPKTATFSASEMDVLTEAWTQFKADRQAALDAEEARQQEVLRTALALAGSVDGIHIEKDEALEDYHSYSYNPPRPGWKVTHPGTSSTKAYFYPDGLLDGVHLMITEWGEHLLEKQKALDELSGVNTSWRSRKRSMTADESYREVMKASGFFRLWNITEGCSTSMDMP